MNFSKLQKGQKVLPTLTAVLMGVIAAWPGFQNNIAGRTPRANVHVENPGRVLRSEDRIKTGVVRNISDLGLQSSGRPSVVLIATHGCEPCGKLLQLILGLQPMPKEMHFIKVGDREPYSGLRWKSLPASVPINITPKTLFFDKKGVLYAEVDGFSDDSRFISGILEKIREITDREKANAHNP